MIDNSKYKSNEDSTTTSKAHYDRLLDVGRL